MEEDGEERGILASIENLDVSLFRPERITKHYDVLYDWHIPVGTLAERKIRTDSRREELLHLLHQDNLSPDQIEGLIKEWISLVIERDKILHQEIRQQENCEEKIEYLQGLRRLLQHRPAMEGSVDEMRLKEALLSLERHLTHYCKSHHIDSPTPKAEPFRSLPPRLTVNHAQGLSDTHSDSDQISTVSPILEVPDGPEVTPLPVATSHNGVVTHPLIQQPTTADLKLSLEIPPPPPPPPLPIRGGTLGTVQFSGTKRQAQPTPKPSTVGGGRSKRKLSLTLTTDTPSPPPSQTYSKGLMDEIASVGKRNLRPTNRPRSPGGTPVKASKRITMMTGNNDMFQRALINKFRSLHSTPIQQGVIHESGSFDFSNAWSDINGSIDDPNITTSDLPSGLLHGSDPNASKRSTAV